MITNTCHVIGSQESICEVSDGGPRREGPLEARPRPTLRSAAHCQLQICLNYRVCPIFGDGKADICFIASWISVLLHRQLLPALINDYRRFPFSSFFFDISPFTYSSYLSIVLYFISPWCLIIDTQ